MITVSAFFGTVLFYQFVPAKGEDSAITSFINKYLSTSEDWAEINAVHTKAMEQAGYDKNLFQNGGSGQRYVDVSYPEYVVPLRGTRALRRILADLSILGLSSLTRRETFRPASWPTSTTLWSTTGRRPTRWRRRRHRGWRRRGNKECILLPAAA